MKNKIVIFLTIYLVGCTFGMPSKDDYIGPDDLIPHVLIKLGEKNKIFYIVEPDKLMLSRVPIKYAGSINSYHLFMVIPKRPIAYDEIMNFSVVSDCCIIEDPSSPEKELNSGKPRWIKFKDGKIIVDGNRS